jgi:hypothetical protein
LYKIFVGILYCIIFTFFWIVLFYIFGDILFFMVMSLIQAIFCLNMLEVVIVTECLGWQGNCNDLKKNDRILHCIHAVKKQRGN